MTKKAKKKVVSTIKDTDVNDDIVKNEELEVSDEFKNSEDSEKLTLEDNLTKDIGQGFMQIKNITLRNGAALETGPNSNFRRLAQYILRLYNMKIKK